MMLSNAVAIPVLVWCFVLTRTAEAACSATAACTAGANVQCDLTYIMNQISLGSPTAFLQYYACVPQQAPPSCCGDPCFLHSDFSSCASDPSGECIGLPSVGTQALCVHRDKLCGMYNQSICELNPLCVFSASVCMFRSATSLFTPEPASPCPALHPLVIAMLALMLFTFVVASICICCTARKYQQEEKLLEEQGESANSGER